MPTYTIVCIEKEADNSIIGAKLCQDDTTDVSYFSGIRVTKKTFPGRPNEVTDLHTPVRYKIDSNRVRMWGSNEVEISLPINESNLTAAGLKILIDDCNCCGSGGGTSHYQNDETGENAPESPTEPATIPDELSEGTTVAEFYDDAILYWTYDGADWVLNYTQTLATSGEKRVLPDARSVAYQTAGDDVTISRTTGGCTITVPANVYALRSFHLTIDADNGDQGGDSAYEIDIVYLGTRTFNQNADLSDAVFPNDKMLVFNTGTTVTPTTDNAFEGSRPAAGTIRINYLAALQAPFDKRLIILNFE